MYADDDEDDKFLFQLAIQDTGIPCNVTYFPTGVDLITALEKSSTHPDIIFMDINIPLKNGLECIKEMRQNQRWDTIPMYVISTSDADIFQEQAINFGASGYICKPPSFDKLRETINLYLHPLSEGSL